MPNALFFACNEDSALQKQVSFSWPSRAQLALLWNPLLNLYETTGPRDQIKFIKINYNNKSNYYKNCFLGMPVSYKGYIKNKKVIWNASNVLQRNIRVEKEYYRRAFARLTIKAQNLS